MSEERGMSMNEFKVVIEAIRSDIKKVVEVVNFRFDKVEKEMHGMKEDIHSLKSDVQVLKSDVQVLKTDMKTVKDEIGFLHEGQTEIKNELRTELKNKVSYTEFGRLEKRVARLEKRTA
jgi:chromosome segregation ATPase